MKRQLRLISILILMSFSTRSYGVEAQLDVELECVVASNNEELGYTKKLYDDIFVIKLSHPKSVGKVFWKRRHPGSNDYTRLETIRGCAFAKWNPSTLGQTKKLEVRCGDDGEDGILLLDFDSLEGELAFYNSQIGYSERSSFAVVCKIQSN